MGNFFNNFLDPNEVKPKHEVTQQPKDDKVVCYSCRWRFDLVNAAIYRGEGIYVCPQCKDLTHFQIELLSAINSLDIKK